MSHREAYLNLAMFDGSLGEEKVSIDLTDDPITVTINLCPSRFIWVHLHIGSRLNNLNTNRLVLTFTLYIKDSDLQKDRNLGVLRKCL